jgi:hypothetical protein
MVGTIAMRQQLGENRKASISTRLQFEFPAKIYIRQDMEVQTPNDHWTRSWLVTGDGVGFSYNPPEAGIESRNRNRLYETVEFKQPKANKKEFTLPPKPPLDVRGIYGVITKSIGDRTLPIDVAFGRTEDLRFIRNQLLNVKFEGPESVNGVECSKITGEWRESALVEKSGYYNIWITASGELKRFARKELVTVPNGPSGDVITVWEVDLKKNAKPDPELFKVIL